MTSNNSSFNKETWEKENELATKLLLEHSIIQQDKIKGLTDFLEYEEALTKDKDTASRITTLLKQLGVWQTSTTQ
jgi:adenylate cyclase class IV